MMALAGAAPATPTAPSAMATPLSSDPTLAAFGSSLTAITLAELGDKTFFMALIALVQYDIKRVVDGGETNYVSATLAIYLDIYNVFQSLLALLGIVGGERD